MSGERVEQEPVEQEPQESREELKAQREYDYYLGVFVFLGFVLLGTAGWYHVHYPHFPFRYYTWIITGLATLIPTLFRGRTHVLTTTNEPIPLTHKKAMLLVAFSLYVSGAALLTMWGGGRQAAAGNLLVLTSGLSVYVAKKDRTKFWVGLIAMACYAGSSVYWYDPQRGLVLEHDGGTWFDFVLVLITMYLAAYTSRGIKTRSAPAGQASPAGAQSPKPG